MDRCDLHTVLRLPTGIFYAQGVKTNVFFFTRGKTDTGNTKEVWIYDLRSNMPGFGKRTPLSREHFRQFEKAYGADPYGKSPRSDEGERGRFRRFTREQIKRQRDSLDASWLNDYSDDEATQARSPDEMAKRVEAKLRFALKELAASERV